MSTATANVAAQAALVANNMSRPFPITCLNPRRLLYLVALFLTCFWVCVEPSIAQFETRGSFVAQSDSTPRSVALGDFNHDGELDLAVVSYCCPGGGVSILLGKGDGTFEPSVTYAAGEQPFSLVAADFNHDGNLDLAVANSLSTYISILMGNGDGTFQSATQSPPLSDPATYVTVGDFNRDGNLDLLALGDNNISVLMGDGDGRFQDAVTTEPPFAVGAVGVGDFDRDGKLDLATAGTFGSTSSINILLGNGDGTFAYGASYEGQASPESIAVADLNGDHKLDLAIANTEGGSVSVLLGNGDGTFQTAVSYPVAFPVWVTVADVNGDRTPDLVVAADFSHAVSGAVVFLGKGDGTFQSSRYYPGASPDTSYVAAGDLNGDRMPDLVFTDFLNDDVIALLNTSTVSFSPTTPLNFKKQAVGTTSGPQRVTLANSGKTALNISAMKVAGQFAMTSSCRANVASGAKCTISVTFSPKSKGAKSGTVTINDSASSQPMVIELTGTGT